MKTELQNKLFDKYPKIFAQKDLPTSQTSLCWGIDTGDGWYDILDTLCGQIQNHQNLFGLNVEAVQVKQKFGGLRFYYNGGDEFIEGLTSMAEAISNRTCEECGSPATTTTRGHYTKTQCLRCSACEDYRDNLKVENEE
jgi:hypothetical protein